MAPLWLLQNSSFLQELTVSFDISVCQCVSLLLCRRHAKDKFCVEEDQGDTGDEMDKDNTEPVVVDTNV